MFYLTILVVGLLIIWRSWSWYKAAPGPDEYGSLSRQQSWAVFWIIVGGALVISNGIALSVGTAKIIDNQNYVTYSQPLLEQRREQRDALLALLKAELSDENYIRIINATVPEDVQFLALIPGIDSFLLGKADRLVAVNQAYFSLYNSILKHERSVCSSANNFFYPSIPFIEYECDIETENN